MPVPSLWLDILQKIKAAGYNSVSFYVNWGLLEAKPGEVRAEGIFALEPLFEAAEKAGLYLFAVCHPTNFLPGILRLTQNQATGAVYQC